MVDPLYPPVTTTKTSSAPVSLIKGIAEAGPTVTISARPTIWTPPTSSREETMFIYVVILALAVALSVVGLLVCNYFRLRGPVIKRKPTSFSQQTNRHNSDGNISAAESDTYPLVA